MIGAVVLDADGTPVGKVWEIEARKTGLLVSEWLGNALQVGAFHVGTAGVFLRLGYFSREMLGPHGLRFLARRTKGLRVRWEQVESLEGRTVRLNRSQAELETISGDNQG